MNALQLDQEHSQINVSGVIDFDTAPKMRRVGEVNIRQCHSDQVVVDLNHVTYCNSVAISLIFAWRRYARTLGKEIRVVGLPDTLQKIATLCDVSELLSA